MVAADSNLFTGRDVAARTQSLVTGALSCTYRWLRSVARQ